MNSFWTPDLSSDEVHQHIEALVLNPLFRQWVLRPDPDTELYWADYQEQLPDRADLVRQARAVVLALQMPDYTLSDEVVGHETDQLLRRIGQASAEVLPPEAPVRRLLWSRVGRWAAAALVLLALGWWAQGHEADPPAGGVAVTTDMTGQVVEIRTDESARRVHLPDGSTVTLEPHSSLRYPPSFSETRRVVLSGRGFFEVVPNPQKPFLVYTDEVVTRVLGTSFTVTTRRGQPATVAVRTGKVSVYTRQAFEQSARTGQTAVPGVVLTPNQEAVFNGQSQSLTKALVLEPLPLPTTQPRQVDFEARPVTEVLRTLEQTYGVEIVYDKVALSHCTVTVTLLDEPLFTQLDILSKLIDARYEVTDTKVILQARGCP